MSTEYRLSYTAEEINQKLGMIDTLGTALTEGAVQTEHLAAGAVTAEKIADGVLLQGEDGYTPVRGVDYWTAEDQAAIRADAETFIAEELAARGQLKPEFANSIEECTDTSKLYVLPDGLIYAYILTEKEVESGPSYTNKLPSATDTGRTTIFGEDYNGDGVKDGYIEGKRLSSSSGSLSDATGMCASGFIFPVSEGSVIRIKGATPNQSATGAFLITYDSSNTMTKWVEIPKNTAKSDWSSTTSKSYYRYDAANNEITITLDSTFGTGYNAIRFSAGTMSADTIVTVDEEIKEGGGTTTVTEYAWVSTGHAFVPADYEDRLIALEEKNSEQDRKINGLITDVKNRYLMFISPNGDDSNSGLTSSTPKKTVKACVSAGATRISAQRGVYDEVIQLDNIGELEIFPTDNDKEFVLGESREPIVFEKVDRYTPSDFEAYNSIKRMAYSNADNTQFDKVFTKQSQPPVIGDGYGSRYNSTIWLLSSDEKAVCVKLKPVLTLAECEGEINTFTYVSGYIHINADMTNVEQVVVPMAWETGFRINKAQNITLREVHVRFSGSYNIDLRNCAYFDLYKCACKYTSYGSGFHPFNSNGVMTSCYATKNFDGYGISEHGHTTYIDCVAEFNFDDGMSHHNACEGTVIGGRYEGNGKGGNTPAPGTKVNIYGGIYKDNGSFGIGYLSDTDTTASGTLQGVLMVGNPKGLVVQNNCSVTAISCVFKDNAQDKSVTGSVTEY